MDSWFYFSSPVYSKMLPEYLENAKEVSNEYIEKIKTIVEFSDLFPYYNTENFNEDHRIATLATEIIKTCNTVLDNQGYDMSNYELVFTEFWVQEHQYGGGQERHVHGNGNILTGFYFLECPEDSCKLVIHDPRPAKEFGNYLPEKDVNNGTDASEAINFNPVAGQLIITNAYLPHTFTKNSSKEFFKMLHFNVSAIYKTANIV
jgi:uncharacterized protein (TIGR02466 family)